MICSAISWVFFFLPLTKLREGNVFTMHRDSPRPWSQPFLGHGTSLYRDSPAPSPQGMGSYCNTDLVAKIDTCSNVFTWTPPPTLLVLTFGGYWSTYGLQTGDTHRTEMLSCLVHLMLTKNSRLFPIFSVITYGILTSDCLMLWRCHSCAKNSPWAWHVKDKDIYSPERNICCPHQLLKIWKAAKKKE